MTVKWEAVCPSRPPSGVMNAQNCRTQWARWSASSAMRDFNDGQQRSYSRHPGHEKGLRDRRRFSRRWAVMLLRSIPPHRLPGRASRSRRLPVHRCRRSTCCHGPLKNLEGWEDQGSASKAAAAIRAALGGCSHCAAWLTLRGHSWGPGSGWRHRLGS